MFVFPGYLGQIKMQGFLLLFCFFLKDVYVVPTIKLRTRYMFVLS